MPRSLKEVAGYTHTKMRPSPHTPPSHCVADHLGSLGIVGNGVVATQSACRLLPHGLGYHFRGDGQPRCPHGLEDPALILLLAMATTPKQLLSLTRMDMGHTSGRGCGQGGMSRWRMNSKRAHVSGWTYRKGRGAL